MFITGKFVYSGITDPSGYYYAVDYWRSSEVYGFDFSCVAKVRHISFDFAIYYRS